MLNQTVFLVDDDAAVADSVRALLESEGYHVEAFSSAEDFLEQFDDRGSGCLILDMRLTGMSGMELLKHLKLQSVRLSIVVISGHADAKLHEQALQFGASACLQKPFSGDTLLDAVQKALETE